MPTTQNNGFGLLYFPMMVSEGGLVQAGKFGATSADWEKLRALPEEKQSILVSKEIAFKIQSLQEQFSLNDVAIGNISLAIRQIFFGELSLEECEAKIGSLLMTRGGGDPNQARAIIDFIQSEILTLQPKPEAAVAVATEEPKKTVPAILMMPLLQALSKYEQLGNQLITAERIRVKSQSDSVRPSLLYWLKYYRDELGVGHHDSVQRGQFLFRSENGKRLSAEERERVNMLLKSVEENMPLPIDTLKSEIVFPRFEAPPARPAPFAAAPSLSSPAPAAVSPLAFEPRTQRSAVTPAMSNTGASVTPGSARAFEPPAVRVAARVPVPAQTLAPTPPPSVAPPVASPSFPAGQGLYQAAVQSPAIEPASAEKATGGSISFSSSHVFPAEREQAPEPMPQKSTSFHIRPVSMLQKKETAPEP